MNNLPIIAIIGMAVLVTATVGFGATLTNTPQFNLIGGSDNNAVTTARGNITALVWAEEVGKHGEIETDLITFTVGNEDSSNSHDFQICAVIEFNNGSAYFSPPVGSPPACTTTSGPITLDAILTSQTIDFVLPVNVTEIVDISFTIEEVS